jgi:hypothetical protein
MPLEKWQVYYTFCFQAKPHPKFKYVVLAHVTPTWCLGLFINSDLNTFVKHRSNLWVCMPGISSKDQSFLNHDSFIDCTSVYTFLATDLKDYRGKLSDTAIGDVLQALQDCSLVKNSHKKLILVEH